LIIVHAALSYLRPGIFSCRFLGSCLHFITSSPTILILFKGEHFLLILIIVREIFLGPLSFLSIVRNQISLCLLGGEVSFDNIRYLGIHGSAFAPLAFELTFLKIVVVVPLIDVWLVR